MQNPAPKLRPGFYFHQKSNPIRTEKWALAHAVQDHLIAVVSSQRQNKGEQEDNKRGKKTQDWGLTGSEEDPQGNHKDHRHLWIRTPRQQAILRVRAEVIRAARDWLDNNDFVLVDTPILTPDMVTITQAHYHRSTNILHVEAESDTAGCIVTLLSPPYSEGGLSLKFEALWTPEPDSVTLTSSCGGSDSATVKERN